MPVVPVAAVAAALGVAATSAVAIVVTAAINLVIGVALSIGVSALTQKSGRRDFGTADFGSEAAVRTQESLDPLSPWRYVYGRVRIGGAVLWQGTKRKHLHQVHTLCAGPIEGVKTFWVDQDPVYPEQLDSRGYITSGKYRNLIRFVVDRGGSPGAQPFPDLVALNIGWTDEHRQAGHAKVWILWVPDRDVFAGRRPQFSFTVKGRRVEEVTASGAVVARRWTPNAAWCIRDYMTLARDRGGAGCAGLISEPHALAAANICDEMPPTTQVTHAVLSIAGSWLDLDGDVLEFQDGDLVRLTTSGTLPGGLSADTDYYVIAQRERRNGTTRIRIGLAATLDDAYDEAAIPLTSPGSGSHAVTRWAEPRYTACGVVSTDNSVASILDDMRSAMSGRIVWLRGRWVIDAAAWRPPMVCIEPRDRAPGAVTVRANQPARARFNAVQGKFATPLNLGEPSDYPPVISAVLEAQDGGVRNYTTLDLPFTSRSSTARRIAKIQLHRVRREIRHELIVNACGFVLDIGDIVAVDEPRRGWAQKTFEIAERSLTTFATGDDENARALAVRLVLHEIDANAFDFDPVADDIDFRPSPRTEHEDPLFVPPPLGLTVATEGKTLGIEPSVITTWWAVLRWQAPDDAYVTEAGAFLPEFRETGTEGWNPAVPVDGRVTRTQIGPLVHGQYYDFQVWAKNRLGALSATPAALYGYRIGDAVGGANSIWDLGSSSEAVTIITDLGRSSDPVETERDLNG